MKKQTACSLFVSLLGRVLAIFFPSDESNMICAMQQNELSVTKIYFFPLFQVSNILNTGPSIITDGSVYRRKEHPERVFISEFSASAGTRYAGASEIMA